MNIYGFIPVRMKSSRLKGKPLLRIRNLPMLHHVYYRASKFKGWEDLKIATCDNEIINYCKKNNLPWVKTSTKHRGCLDRVFEGANKISKKLKNEDVVICIQGDEPMLVPSMISSLIKPFKNNKNAKSTVLGMRIVSPEQYYSDSIVKIIHNKDGKVLYNSRAPVPYSKSFSLKLNARRIYGIFGFKWKYFQKYNSYGNSFLEKIESIDTNRVCDNGDDQFVAPFPFIESYSVDTIDDLKVVEKKIINDKLWKEYKNIKPL